MKVKANYFIVFLIFTLTNINAQTTLEWVREYTGDFELQDARDIAVDDDGNVIVGITSFDTVSREGFTLIKYDSDGVVKWIQKYEGDFEPGKSNSKDNVRDITVDHENNVYVVGRSEFLQAEPYDVHTTFITIKYNSKGQQQWLAEFRVDSLGNGWYWPNGIAVDSSGNVYVQGQYGTGVLLKYDSSGTKLWERHFDNERVTGPYDKCMVMDSKANVYIADKDFSVVKYDASGNLIWLAKDDSLKNADTRQADIAVDYRSNLYITGIQDYNNFSTYLTTKYNNNGTLQWTRRYGGQLYYNYTAFGVAVDSLGNVYVSGYVFADFAQDDQFVTIKYDSSGNELWVEKFDGPPNTWGTIWNMAIDNLNNICIIGQVIIYSTNYSNLTLVKYDSNGNLLFSDYYSENGRNEEASKIAIDEQNNIYLTGDSFSSKAQKVITLKYSQKPVSVEPDDKLIPDSPELYQNYPNPFNPITTIFYSLPKTARINIKIYDLLGREVKTLYSGQQRAGKHKVVFNAENLASGIYIYRLQTKEFTISRKLLLIK